MSVRLLDVNILVSLMDSAHVHHTLCVQWFREVAVANGWATCAVTEMGFIRVVSSHAYPNRRLTPATAGEMLRRFRQSFPEIHRFWADDFSPCDLQLSALTGPRQITDAWLAALAFRKGGILATLDGSIPWQSVSGATEQLVERIA